MDVAELSEHPQWAELISLLETIVESSFAVLELKIKVHLYCK
jgi:hypothetical protein